METIIGHAHHTLVNSTFTVNSGVAFDLGTYQVDKFSRLVGIASVVGSLTLRWQLGPNSGTYLVSSTTVINSGGSHLDLLNFGKFANFTLTAVVSSQPQFFIQGEPFR